MDLVTDESFPGPDPDRCWTVGTVPYLRVLRSTGMLYVLGTSCASMDMRGHMSNVPTKAAASEKSDY